MPAYDVKRPSKTEKRHGWIASGPRGRSNRSHFVRTLIKYVKLYCKYTKLAGFKFFVEPGKTWFDRTLWFLLYAITVPIMIFTIYHAYLQFIDNPFLTSVDAEYHPTYKLYFPGISICSINRISRQSAMELANEVFSANISRLSFDEILELVSQLGELYESEFIVHKGSHLTHQLLSQFYGGYYDITEVMKRVTPQCSAVLARCHFQGDEHNCSDVFTFRKTQDGFCCTFNYATRGDDLPVDGMDHRLEPIKVENLGEDAGLSVLLEPVPDDNFYSIFPITGWKVTVFNPYDYPDTTSGGVTDILVPPSSQVNVEIDAIRFYSTADIKLYQDKRNCVFSEEMTALRASYTYSDCIVDCKIEDIWQTCKCTPFYFPNRESRRVCNAEDVACLAKHKSKWFTVIPRDDAVYDASMNATWALRCRNCYPECTDVKYVAQTSIAMLNPGYYSSRIMDGVHVENQSTLHVYFNRFGTISLRQDVLFRWYELMSDASGICGIFVGFSLIAIVEFGYFVGLFLFELCKGPASGGDKTRRKQQAIQTIYWGELYPSKNSRTTKDRYDRNRDKF